MSERINGTESPLMNGATVTEVMPQMSSTAATAATAAAVNLPATAARTYNWRKYFKILIAALVFAIACEIIAAYLFCTVDAKNNHKLAPLYIVWLTINGSIIYALIILTIAVVYKISTTVTTDNAVTNLDQEAQPIELRTLRKRDKKKARATHRRSASSGSPLSLAGMVGRGRIANQEYDADRADARSQHATMHGGCGLAPLSPRSPFIGEHPNPLAYSPPAEFSVRGQPSMSTVAATAAENPFADPETEEAETAA